MVLNWSGPGSLYAPVGQCGQAHTPAPHVSPLVSCKWIGDWLVLRSFMQRYLRYKSLHINTVHSCLALAVSTCSLCAAPESMEHIFFQCDLALFLLSYILLWINNNWNPSSFVEVRSLAHSFWSWMASCSGSCYPLLGGLCGPLGTNSPSNTVPEAPNWLFMSNCCYFTDVEILE